MEEQKDIFDFLEKRQPNVPSDDYFAGLANDVLREVETAPKKTKVIPLYRRSILWVSTAIAAAVLLFLLMQPGTEELVQPSVDFDDLSRGEILAYVEYNLDDFDEELLAEFIPENRMNYSVVEDISAQQSVPETTVDAAPELEQSLDAISTEDILDYLEDEGMELEDLEDDIFN